MQIVAPAKRLDDEEAARSLAWPHAGDVSMWRGATRGAWQQGQPTRGPARFSLACLSLVFDCFVAASQRGCRQSAPPQQPPQASLVALISRTRAAVVQVRRPIGRRINLAKRSELFYRSLV